MRLPVGCAIDSGLCRTPMRGLIQITQASFAAFNVPCGTAPTPSTNRGRPMSNVIRFIECMGQDAALRHATGEDLQILLADARLEPQEQAIILAGDQTRLETLIGATKVVCCGIMPGKDDEDDDD